MTIADIHVSEYQFFVLTDQCICVRVTDKGNTPTTNTKY